MVMIDASRYDAVFEHTYNGDKVRSRSPLVCWVMEDGEPHGYYLSSEHDSSRGWRKGLRRADAMTNFLGYEESEARVHHVLPAAPGWWLVYMESESVADIFARRILGWRLDDTGIVLGVITEPDAEGFGDVEETSEKHRAIYDPVSNAEAVAFEAWNQAHKVTVQPHDAGNPACPCLPCRGSRKYGGGGKEIPCLPIEEAP